MTISSLPRRTVLQAGAAVAGPLLAGIWPSSGHAVRGAAEPALLPVSGTLAGWVVVRPGHGATIRFIQLDADGQPVRQVTEASVALAGTGASLQQIGQRAHELALETIARSWGVPAAECAASHGRIAHEGGRAAGYLLWVDVT